MDDFISTKDFEEYSDRAEKKIKEYRKGWDIEKKEHEITKDMLFTEVKNHKGYAQKYGELNNKISGGSAAGKKLFTERTNRLCMDKIEYINNYDYEAYRRELKKELDNI